jgi:hypothetical protein
MDELEVWSFDVTVSTHNLLREGVVEAVMLNGERHHRVVVAADSYAEALLVAGQMASCVPVTALSGRCTRIASDRALATAEARDRGRPSVAPEGEHPMCTGAYLRI